MAMTVEQEKQISEILTLAASDSRFAQKALDSIRNVLGTEGNIVLVTLEPATKPVGAVPFKLKCKGTGFDSTCSIHWNGVPFTTTFTSETEVSADVNLTGITQPVSIPVVVRNTAGIASNTRMFTVTAV